jgi:DNA processing protein
MIGIGWHGPVGPGRFAEEPASSAGGWSSGPPTAEARAAMAVLASVDGIGPVSLERLLFALGGPIQVLEAARSRDGSRAIRAATTGPDDRWPSMRQATAEAVRAAALAPESILSAIEGAGVTVLLIEDAAYPRRLRFIELPPRLLFVRGDHAALEADSAVAVVGTRRPTDEGRRIAGRIGAALCRAGALVVSGLALGIDGAAHAAVVGEGGPTVAVIGGGHDRLFPRGHDRLATAIAEGGGAVISEHAPGVRPSKGTFPRRNRVISGLADAVVVVEAGARSGALVTAAWALEQGRECYLVPGSIESPQAAGCLAWLRDYAGVTRIVAGVPQLLEDLGLDATGAYPTSARADTGPRPRDQAPSPGPTGSATKPRLGQPDPPRVEAVALDLPHRERQLLLALARGASTVDELAAVTGQAVAAILGGLTVLEGRRLVEEEYGRYRIPAAAAGRASDLVDPAA